MTSIMNTAGPPGMPGRTPNKEGPPGRLMHGKGAATPALPERPVEGFIRQARFEIFPEGKGSRILPVGVGKPGALGSCHEHNRTEGYESENTDVIASERSEAWQSHFVNGEIAASALLSRAVESLLAMTEEQRPLRRVHT